MARVKQFFMNYLHWWIILGVAGLCSLFIILGTQTEEGFITLDGKPSQIQDYTNEFIENSNDALYRLMNEDKPSENADFYEVEAEGQGAYTTLDQVKARRKPDGDNDNGNGWQCSKYTAYLATGKKDYSSAHPDYGPVNGKNVVAWLVQNYGWKYTDNPVEGAIGSGGFNTQYGHTVMFLYWTGNNTAMVNDANWTPLRVGTHNMNVSGWVWAVPGDYTPSPSPSPTPTPEPVRPQPKSGDVLNYTYVYGDYFSKVLVNLGIDEGHLWGAGGTVEYYTNQLIEQNMLDKRGNVFVGVPFKLTVR